MSSKALLVLIGGELAGYLEQGANGKGVTFVYDEAYSRGDNVPLSLRLPLSRDIYGPDRVEPYLAGLLPEDPETRARWAVAAGAGRDDWFSILAHMGLDCPGAVQFCLPERIEDLTVPGTYEPCTEADVAARLRELSQNSASWAMPDEHWSLAGQQEKFALARFDGQWAQARGSAPTTHIIKPGIKTLHHQALVEHATQQAAALSGLRMAHSEFLQFEDQWAIVSERYDRTVVDGILVRLHQEDFCQAVGRMPSRKYEAPDGPTLRDMFTVARRNFRDVRAASEALGDFLAINVVAGAPDGHSKNISLLHSPGGPIIAPFYDLATGLAYDSREVDRATALSVGGERVSSRIRGTQWRRAAAILQLDPDAYLGRVAFLATVFPGMYRLSLTRLALGGAPGAMEVLERSADAVAKHCTSVIDRLA